MVRGKSEMPPNFSKPRVFLLSSPTSQNNISQWDHQSEVSIDHLNYRNAGEREIKNFKKNENEGEKPPSSSVLSRRSLMRPDSYASLINDRKFRREIVKFSEKVPEVIKN